jgi:hypothetical protein
MAMIGSDQNRFPANNSFLRVRMRGHHVTRFAREKYDHFALRALLKSLGISLRSATEPIDDTSTGKLMEGVLAIGRLPVLPVADSPTHHGYPVRRLVRCGFYPCFTFDVVCPKHFLRTGASERMFKERIERWSDSRTQGDR